MPRYRSCTYSCRRLGCWIDWSRLKNGGRWPLDDAVKSDCARTIVLSSAHCHLPARRKGYRKIETMHSFGQFCKIVLFGIEIEGLAVFHSRTHTHRPTHTILLRLRNSWQAELIAKAAGNGPFLAIFRADHGHISGGGRDGGVRSGR